MKQLHKKFNDCQVKDLLTRYLQKKIERKDLQEVLGIKKTRFFALVKRLKDDPENFSVSYFRSIPTRTISKDIETNIVGTPRASPWHLFHFSSFARRPSGEFYIHPRVNPWYSALRVNKRTKYRKRFNPSKKGTD